jgi:hypothetical protein
MHPQTWNAYAHVTNNPLSAVDPSGMVIGDPGDPFGPCWNWFGCWGGSSGGGGSDGGGGSGSGPGGTSTSPQPLTATGSRPLPPGSFPGGETAGLPPRLSIPRPCGSQNGEAVACVGWNGSILFASLFGALPMFSTTVTSTPQKAGTRPDCLNNITSFFGYDQRIPLLSCFGGFVSNTISNLFPLLPGLSNVSEEGFGVASRVAYKSGPQLCCKYAKQDVRDFVPEVPVQIECLSRTTLEIRRFGRRGTNGWGAYSGGPGSSHQRSAID